MQAHHDKSMGSCHELVQSRMEVVASARNLVRETIEAGHLTCTWFSMMMHHHPPCLVEVVSQDGTLAEAVNQEG